MLDCSFKAAASLLNPLCSVWSRSFIWILVLWVRGGGADADLLSPGSEPGCVLPSRDSSSPEKPARPYGEPACEWWRNQRFPPAETEPPAPAWERNTFTCTGIHVHTSYPVFITSSMWAHSCSSIHLNWGTIHIFSWNNNHFIINRNNNNV